jgi:hypothetical protein
MDEQWHTVRAEDVTWLEPDSFFVNCLAHARVRVTNVVVYVPLPVASHDAEWTLTLPPYDRLFHVHDACLVRKDARTGGMWRGAALPVVHVAPGGTVKVQAVKTLDGATHVKLRVDVGVVQQWDA